MTGCSPIRFCQLFTAEWLTAIGTVGAVVAAIVLAFWGEQFKRWLVHPRLSLGKLRIGHPDSDSARRQRSGAYAGKAYFFRLAIRNRGKAAAQDVQVFLESVDRIVAGKPERVAECTPMNLLWANLRKPTLPTLLPKMPPFYCDLVHVEQPAPRSNGPKQHNASLDVDVEFPSNTGGHRLGAGTYLFRIILAGSNCKPRYFTVEVVFPGIWFAQKERMFDEGLRMRTVHRKMFHTGFSGEESNDEAEA